MLDFTPVLPGLAPDAQPPYQHMSEDSESLAVIGRQRELALACLLKGGDHLQRVAEFGLNYEQYRDRSREHAERWVAELSEQTSLSDQHPDLLALQALQLRGLDIEARIQHLLGEINGTELALLTQWLNALIEGRAPAGNCELSHLTLEHTGRSTLPGIVVMTSAGARAEPAVQAMTFLAWSRLPGGLRRFDSPGQACSFVHEQLLLETDSSVHLQPAGDDAFALALTLLASQQPLATDDAQAWQSDLLDALLLPIHAPRDHALSMALATQTEQMVARQDMTWFSRLDDATQAQVVQALADHCDALEQARLHTAQALPGRLDFLREQAAQVLQADFGVQGRCEVTITMPQQLVATLVDRDDAFTAHLVPGEESLEDVPPQVVLLPSDTLEQWPLEQLLAYQVDPELEARLAHMSVSVETANDHQALRVRQGITVAWLKACALRLDLAQGYEQLLFTHFNPAAEPDAPARQVLRKPFETALALQSLLAVASGKLSAQQGQHLRSAAAATAPEQWGTLSLAPLAFTLFDEHRQSAGARVVQAMLLSDSQDGQTLLYLPGAPRSTLSAHASQASALAWLAEQCLDPAILDYLTQRASEGDPSWLKARVNQALSQGFRTLFQALSPWPPQRSMAQQLLNEHAGRLIRQHRLTSRTAGDLLVQSVEQSRQQVVDHILLALSYVPVAGTLIGLAEGIHSLYQSVRYFEQSRAPDALLEAQMAMASLLGALVDLLPAGASQRALRRPRPLMALPAQRVRRASGFDGYAQAVSLEGLSPSQAGHLAGTYAHAGSHFIERQGAFYEVRWDADAATWRLKRPGRAFAEQAVARDAQGHWETHLALYGQLIRGGLNGGAGRTFLQRIGNWLPLWLRRYLPSSLLAVMESDAQTFERLRSAYTTTFKQAGAATRAAGDQLLPEAQYQQMMDKAAAHVRAADELLEFWENLSSQKKKVFSGNNAKAETAQLAVNRFVARAYTLNARSRRRNHIQHQIVALDAQTRLLAQQFLERSSAGASDTELVALLEQLLQLRTQARRWLARRLIEEDLMIEAQRDVTAARRPITADRRAHLSAQGQAALKPLEKFVDDLTQRRLEGAQTRTLAELFVRELGTPESIRLHNRYQVLCDSLHDALILYRELPTANLNPLEQAAIKRQINDLLDQFRGQINALARQDAHLIDSNVHGRLVEQLMTLRQNVRQAQTPTQRDNPAAHPRRPFQDQQGRWYLGVRQPDGHYVIEPLGGQEQRWVPVAGTRRFARQQAADAAPGRRFVAQSPEQLRNTAEHALNAAADAEIRAEQLSRASTTTGSDIQGFLDAEADRLGQLGSELNRHQGQRHHSLARQLLDRADQLRQVGLNQRTAFSKNPQVPSASKLDFLLRHDQARVRPVGSRRQLRVDDHLQEFEITDSATGSPLWYAHYHYRHANDNFLSFTKAHLKTPEQRHLGLNWQVAQGENAPRILRAPLDVAFSRLHRELFER